MYVHSRQRIRTLTDLSTRTYDNEYTHQTTLCFLWSFTLYFFDNTNHRLAQKTFALADDNSKQVATTTS